MLTWVAGLKSELCTLTRYLGVDGINVTAECIYRVSAVVYRIKECEFQISVEVKKVPKWR